MESNQSSGSTLHNFSINLSLSLLSSFFGDIGNTDTVVLVPYRTIFYIIYSYIKAQSKREKARWHDRKGPRVVSNWCSEGGPPADQASLWRTGALRDMSCTGARHHKFVLAVPIWRMLHVYCTVHVRALYSSVIQMYRIVLIERRCLSLESVQWLAPAVRAKPNAGGGTGVCAALWVNSNWK